MTDKMIPVPLQEYKRALNEAVSVIEELKSENKRLENEVETLKSLLLKFRPDYKDWIKKNFEGRK